MAFTPTIGQMKMVVKFEQVIKSSDDTGGQNEQYVDWFTTRGFIREKRVYDAFESGYDESVKIYEGWIWWRNEIEANISKDTRLIFEGRSFKMGPWSQVGEHRKMIHLKQLTEVR
jgi:head-tail adaptor